MLNISMNEYLREESARRSILAEASRRLQNPIQQVPGDSFPNYLIQKLVESRKYVLSIEQPLQVGVVFAMWRESRRLGKNSQNNPLGEDCLVAKIEALNWLCAGSKVDWHLYGIDDGCDEGSLEAALERIDRHECEQKVTLRKLADDFPYSTAPLSRLTAVELSQKGGSILRGFELALADDHDFIVYTDCDNSVHLGQLGLLLEPALEQDKAAVFGDRFDDASFYFWHPDRTSDAPGLKIISHIRRGLFEGGLLTKDVPSPFKLFSAGLLRQVLPRLSLFDFHFDFDVIMAVKSLGAPTSNVSYAFVDSFEESTWPLLGQHKIWFDRLKGVILAARRNGIKLDEDLADIIDRFINSHGDIGIILTNPVPPQLLGRPDEDLGKLEIMPANEVAAFLTSIGLQPAAAH